MTMLRNVDVFVKPRHDLRSKSAIGGLITVIASSAAIILFIAQLYFYIVGITNHTLHLSESRSIPLLPAVGGGHGGGGAVDPFLNRMFEIRGKIPLKVHVTFPHLSCDMLEVKLDNASPTKKDFDPKNRKQLEKRIPNTIELKQALGSNYNDFSSSSTNTKDKNSGGCTIRTVLRIPIVAGHLTITLTKNAWTKATKHLMLQQQMSEYDKFKNKRTQNMYNVSHYIHSIQFGKPFPLTIDDPLENRAHIIENNMGGIALENIQVKLVPTVYKRLLTSTNTYQTSVVTHTVQPETLVANGVPLLPGLTLGYDITPLAVHHVEGRDNIFVFLSSLVSIVGGVFVTVGLLTGCLVHSAAAVAKKDD